MIDIPGIDIPGPGDIIGGIGGFFGGLAADASGAVLDAVMFVIFGMIADAVAAVVSALAPSFNGESTRVDLVGGWFSSDGGQTVTAMTSVIAGSLVTVFLLLSLVRAMFAGEFSAMWRAALIDVPVAFLGTALTVIVASALLAMVDQASVTLVGADGEQLAAFSNSLSNAEAIGGAGLLGILFGLLFIVGAVLVWIQLLVRAALIYIVIAFAPIMWVTRAYPGTRKIAGRGVEIAVALILSKFVMAISFRLGAEALAGGNVAGDGEVDLSAMLVGATIMLLTAFMPFMIFKVIPLVDAATASSGADRAAMGAAVVGGAVAAGGAGFLASKLAGAGGSGGSSELGGSHSTVRHGSAMAAPAEQSDGHSPASAGAVHQTPGAAAGGWSSGEQSSSAASDDELPTSRTRPGTDPTGPPSTAPEPGDSRGPRPGDARGDT